MLRSKHMRPSLAAFIVAGGTAFTFTTACSTKAPDEEDIGGMSGTGTAAGSGGIGGGAGAMTSGGAGVGGAGTGGAGTGGATGGAGSGAGGAGTSGAGGSIGGAGAGAGAGGAGTSGAGAGTSGAGGAMAGAAGAGNAGGAMGGAGAGGAAGLSGSAGSAGGGTAGATADYEFQATDFTCIAEWERPMGPSGPLGFRITNALGAAQTAAAVAVAETAGGAVYPVGTIIQHLPTEAMGKRGAGFSAATKDWEFFQLSLSASGATITARGSTNVMTMGNTCASCHTSAAGAFDFICNTSKDYGGTACDGGFDFPISMLESQENGAANCN